jgi:hypothetical protein
VKRAIVMMLLAVGGTATAQELDLVPTKRAEELRTPRRDLLRPREFFYEELNLQRQNTGLNGRKNAIRDEQRIAETPSLQPRPLSSW